MMRAPSEEPEGLVYQQELRYPEGLRGEKAA
jgi:hypothetical protein